MRAGVVASVRGGPALPLAYVIRSMVLGIIHHPSFLRLRGRRGDLGTKRLIVWICVPLILAPTSARAGLDLSWGVCPPVAGASHDQVFDCSNAGGPYTLYGTFTVPAACESVVGLNVVLDITTQTDLPAFWKMDSGDCNDPNTGGGFSVSPFKPLVGCGSSVTVASWVTSQTGFLFGPVYRDAGGVGVPPGGNHARILWSVARGTNAPVTLNAGTNYFGFLISFITNRASEAGGPCSGCTMPVCINWGYADIVSNTRPTLRLTSPGPFGNVSTINGGVFGCSGYSGNCLTPAQSSLVYRDGDGDHYGDPRIAYSICGNEDATPLTGYVADNTDCDDARAAVHPSATEVCNGIDDNCNGQIDEMAHAPGLVAWWPAENNASDADGTSNGTLTNGATFAVGKVGQAFDLDGVDDFVGITPAASLDFGTGDFSIETWVKFNVLSADQEIFHKVVGMYPNDRAYFLEWDSPATLRFMVHGTTSNQNDFNVPVSLSAGQWHHVAAVRQGNASTLYLDGSSIGSQTAGSNVDVGSGGFARIGQVAPNGVAVSRPFNGEIDELAIYNRALGASEIKAIFDAGSGGRCALLAVNEAAAAPHSFEFATPRPNPFTGAMELDFALPARVPVRAEVVDIAGRRISPLLVDGVLDAGTHRLKWDGRDASGSPVAPGVYLVRISTGAGAAVHSIVLIR